MGTTKIETLSNMQIERKLKAGHGPCWRKSRALLPIPLICGVRPMRQLIASKELSNFFLYDMFWHFPGIK